MSIKPCYYEESLVNKIFFLINHAWSCKENMFICFNSNRTTGRNSPITYTHTHDPLKQTYAST